jgi:hypothetical protein
VKLFFAREDLLSGAMAIEDIHPSGYTIKWMLGRDALYKSIPFYSPDYVKNKYSGFFCEEKELLILQGQNAKRKYDYLISQANAATQDAEQSLKIPDKELAEKFTLKAENLKKVAKAVSETKEFLAYLDATLGEY